MKEKQKGGALASQSGAERDLSRLVFTVFGPPGCGKTWVAMSLSKQWPKDIHKRTRKSKKIVITDLVHIGWDPAALAGLISHNVEVKWSYDMQDILSQYAKKGGFPAAMRALSNDVRTLVYNNDGIIGIVHDTITMMDDFSLAYWEHPDRCPVDRNGDADTRRIFGLHKGIHRGYYSELIQVPEGVSTVFLFHEKILEDLSVVMMGSGKPGGQKQLKTHTAKQLGAAGVNVIPAGSGSGIDIYTRANSLEMALLAKPVKGKPKEVVRHLYPCVVEGRRSKNRFQHLLVEKMEPNLREVIRLIKEGG